MVDPVGSKVSIDRGLARIAPVAPVRVAAPALQASTQALAPSSLQALAQPLAAQPPVDVERVAKIKKAIADGNFPLVPSTIADRLLALKLQWKPNEQA